MSQTNRLPAVTLILIVANIAAAFWVVVQPEAMTQWGYLPENPTALGFLANIFVHANLVHLLSNMVFLAAVGPAAEWSLAPWRYALVYFAGGYCGTAIHGLLASGADKSLALVGASGCIAACVAFYAVRYFTLRVPIAPKVSIPLWSVILVWLGLQVAGVFVQMGQASSSSYWAHLGGFGSGLLLSVFFKAPRQASLVFGHEVLDRMNLRGPDAMVTAVERHLKEHPEDVSAWQKLAIAHRTLGHAKEEQTALMQVVERGAVTEQAAAVLRLAEAKSLGDWPVYRRARLADDLLVPSPEASRALLESILGEPSQPDAQAEALLSLGQLLAQQDEPKSREYLTRLFSEFPLHDACTRAKARGLQP